MARPGVTVERSLLRIYPLLADRRLRAALFLGLMGVLLFLKGNASLILAWIVFALVFLSPVTGRIDMFYRDRLVLGRRAYLLMLKEVFVLVLLCLLFVSGRTLGYYV